jgi:SAM-dependent methyltransferase
MADEITPRTAAFWDAHYEQRAQIWSGRPNAFLIDEVGDLPPGRALDLGCGEGADAIWLARRGWRVTAVDVSLVALERAAATAEEAGVGRIEWRLHDLAHTFPEGSYDLVNAQYLHAPIELPRDEILRRAASLVRPGGTLLVVAHASAPSWAEHVRAHADFQPPDELARELGLDSSEWTLDTCAVRVRKSVSPSGELGTVSDCVVKARRRGEADRLQ